MAHWSSVATLGVLLFPLLVNPQGTGPQNLNPGQDAGVLFTGTGTNPFYGGLL